MTNNNVEDKPTTIIVLDIDQMHMDGNKDPHNAANCWIQSKAYWVKLYSDMAQAAEDKGFNVVFAIVTAKSRVDHLLLEQVSGLYDLMQRHNESNYRFIKDDLCACVRSWSFNGQDWQDYIRFYSLASHHVYSCSAEQLAVPNIETLVCQELDNIPEKLKKTAAIQRIAEAHNVGLSDCWLIDDSRIVQTEAEKAGVNCIKAANKFYDYHMKHIDNELPLLLVKEVLEDLEKEIKHKFFDWLARYHDEAEASPNTTPDPTTVSLDRQSPQTAGPGSIELVKQDESDVSETQQEDISIKVTRSERSSFGVADKTYSLTDKQDAFVNNAERKAETDTQGYLKRFCSLISCSK